MPEYLMIFLADLLADALIEGAKIIIRETFDAMGRKFFEVVQQIDTNGDGVFDSEIVIHTLETIIPNLDDGYCIVNDGDTIGLGMPTFDIIDGRTLTQFADLIGDTKITGNGKGYMIDMDNDGRYDDVIVHVGDMIGDGVDDWGWVTDLDENGIPDASPDAPFYPVGSDEYMSIVNYFKNSEGTSEKSFIIMSSDGAMTVYDETGNITAEDCDTAYSLWVSENGIMNKPLDNYTVTEGLLLIAGIAACFGFVAKIFRRRKVM